MPSAKKVSKALGGNQTAQGFLGNLRGDVSKYDSVKATAPAGLIPRPRLAMFSSSEQQEENNRTLMRCRG